MNIKKILSVLGFVALIALVVPFVIYAVPGVVGAEHSFIVLSASMEPAISPGDAIIVDEREPGAIAVDDVITFVRGEQETPVTHRVIGIEETTAGYLFETKGDGNSDADASPVPGENVIGVTILTIPYIGYVIQAVNSTAGFVMLVVLPITLLALSEVWSLVRGARPDVDADGNFDADTNVDADADVEADISGSEREESVESSEDSTEPAAVTITPGELRLATIVLALGVPYTAYVALRLPTTATISVAFATVFSLFAFGGLLLSARLAATDAPEAGDGEDIASSEVDPVPDGGETK